MIVAATGIVERVRLVEPAGLASSSLCCTERRNLLQPKRWYPSC